MFCTTDTGPQMLKRRRDQIRARLEQVNPVSRARFVAPAVVLSTRARVQTTLLSEIEDRRRWHPEGRYAPAATFRGPSYRKVVERPVSPSKPLLGANGFMAPSRFGFAVPEKVAVCVRRKRRREVLFAVKGTGKGARAKRTRNFFSSMDC